MENEPELNLERLQELLDAAGFRDPNKMQIVETSDPTLLAMEYGVSADGETHLTYVPVGYMDNLAEMVTGEKYDSQIMTFDDIPIIRSDSIEVDKSEDAIGGMFDPPVQDPEYPKDWY